jgi:TrpR-related protein YerC/YecD
MAQIDTEPKDQTDLFGVLATLRDVEECRMFLRDLCTPAELTAMADRWKAARLLREGLPYRLIYQKSGVSTATVTRVARCLSSGAGGYQLILDRMANKKKDHSKGKKREK